MWLCWKRSIQAVERYHRGPRKEKLVITNTVPLTSKFEEFFFRFVRIYTKHLTRNKKFVSSIVEFFFKLKIFESFERHQETNKNYVIDK